MDLVFVIPCLSIHVCRETIKGNACGALFHAPLRMPKVGSDYSIVTMVQRFVCYAVMVVVEFLGNDVQGSSVF
eukprot:CAMPEP_0197271798 /NCGR_PEP_ID=MMETSP1432-20130617/8992_1 /TAXON_ID=44447 /ORGANISM="Pseudo-nitzschia delicatissima, Strain UNC1205" /LENGTH=72 /DNA_ID=CAMNT_0042737255 /DNA_START=235 /DNA_END=453 /DNA_ORIENTATION=+